MLYPQVAAIDCDECSKVSYDLKTGKKRMNGDRTIPVSHPPCHYDKKICPKGSPGESDLSEFSEDILKIYRYYEGIEQWPTDPWLLRWRAVIRRTFEDARDEARNPDKDDEDIPKLVVK